jgi:hypothetical protein
MTLRIKAITALGLLALLPTLNFQLSTVHAEGTAFTCQGRLNDGSAPANGSYDLRFASHDSPGGGVLVGGPLTNAPTAMSNGLFTVTLDPGAGAFIGGGLGNSATAQYACQINNVQGGAGTGNSQTGSVGNYRLDEQAFVLTSAFPGDVSARHQPVPWKKLQPNNTKIHQGIWS